MFYSTGYQYAPHSSVTRNFNSEEQVSDYSASSFANESGDNVVLCCFVCVHAIGTGTEHVTNASRKKTKITLQSAK